MDDSYVSKVDYVMNHNCCLIFWKLVNLTGLYAVEHFAIVTLFLEIESVI